jgi:signal transduction histidine kinase
MQVRKLKKQGQKPHAQQTVYLVKIAKRTQSAQLSRVAFVNRFLLIITVRYLIVTGRFLLEIINCPNPAFKSYFVGVRNNYIILQAASTIDQTFTLPLEITPANEALRIAKLHLYDIIDTPEEEVFDKIAMLAAQVFDTPAAFISFVDAEKVFYKSSTITIKGRELERNKSLCALIIVDEHDVVVINDTYTVPALKENNYTVPKTNTRFYAGAALITIEGFKIGSLCVTDDIPREPTKKQLDMLATLASFIMDELELRLVTKKSVRVQTDLMNIVLHELKNPLMNISLAAEMLEEEANAGNLPALSKLILRNTQRLDEKLNDLLNLSQIENREFSLNKELVDLTEMLEMVKGNFSYLALQKKQQIKLKAAKPFFITADKKRLQEILDNLLNNAIKFSYPNTVIQIKINQSLTHIEIEFQDQGQGLNETDKEKLFTKFAKLSAIPTGKERSNGLGLSIVKILAELHHGKVWATSEGKNKGASFFVSLPLEEEQYKAVLS